MALRTTTWRPDTCACEIQYTWDDTVAENARTHTPVIGKKCPAHVAVASVAAQHTTVLEENTRKNRVIARLKTLQPNLFGAVDGNFTGLWSYDGSRVLSISHSVMTAGNKTSLRTWSNTNLGTGKVVVT